MATRTEIHLIGMGKFLPQPIPVASSLRRSRPAHKGKLITAPKVYDLFGPRTICHQIDENGQTLTYEQGGRNDTQMCVEATQEAIRKSGIPLDELNQRHTLVVRLGCTFEDLHLCTSFGKILSRVGLRKAHPLEQDLGCAAVAWGLHEILIHAASRMFKYVIFILSNAVEGVVLGDEEVEERLRMHPDPWAWGSLVFASGASTSVFKIVEVDSSSGQKPRGLLAARERTLEHELVTYGSGGSGNPPRASNLFDQLYRMNAPLVGEIFVPSILKAVEDLKEDWAVQVEPVLGYPFSFDRVKRVYFHQANRWRIQDAVDALKLDPRKVPTNIERFGNTTCASTFLLLEEDFELGLVNEGDLVVFLLVGAGLGAMLGYGVMVI